MSGRHLALLLMAVTLWPAQAEARLEVVSPRDGGLVLGDLVPLHATGVKDPPECRLDGQLVQLQWTRLPRRRHWVAQLRVATPGNHELELRQRRRRVRVRFVSGVSNSVEVGDLVATEALAARDVRELKWLWGPAVFLYGLQRFSQHSPLRARYTRELVAYHAHHETQGLPTIDYPDRCAPALTAVGLARDEGERVGLPGAGVVADYLRREQRNSLGAIDHLGSDSRMRRLANATRLLRLVGVDLFVRHWTHSIWVDSLVMYGLVCVQYGRLTGDQGLYEFGLEQPGIFARVLQDPRTGLFGHAWDTEHARPMGATWLRGNGWVAASLVEMLEEVPVGHPRRPELIAILRDLAAGLMATQDAAGLWPTLVDDEDSYQETSGAALAAFALARGARRGYLSSNANDAARAAFRALTARLRPRGVGYVVSDTSVATSAWPRMFYGIVRRQDDVDWGVGSYLLLAGELRGESW